MKLGKREKHTLWIGAIVLAIFLIFHFIVDPVFEKKERLKKGIGVKAAALEDIVNLSAQYNSIRKSDKQIQEIIEKRAAGFTLFSFLERAGGIAKVKDHIKYMKPDTSEGAGPYQEAMVEMKLEKITLSQLVRYLYRIESLDNIVFVKRLSIMENREDSNSLDAIVQAFTYMKKES